MTPRKEGMKEGRKEEGCGSKMEEGRRKMKVKKKGICVSNRTSRILLEY
jgi:hypothetical protein